MRGRFGLPGFAEQPFAYRAGGKQFGFLSQARRFLAESFFW
jgi:hypothetical protein